MNIFISSNKFCDNENVHGRDNTVFPEQICLIKEYKAFTADELYLIENYNLLQQQIWELENSPELQNLRRSLANVRVAFFTKFYDNCPKVGSTLKPTKKSKLHPEKSHLPF